MMLKSEVEEAVEARKSNVRKMSVYGKVMGKVGRGRLEEHAEEDGGWVAKV